MAATKVFDVLNVKGRFRPVLDHISNHADDLDEDVRSGERLGFCLGGIHRIDTNEEGRI